MPVLIRTSVDAPTGSDGTVHNGKANPLLVFCTGSPDATPIRTSTFVADSGPALNKRTANVLFWPVTNGPGPRNDVTDTTTCATGGTMSNDSVAELLNSGPAVSVNK